MVDGLKDIIEEEIFGSDNVECNPLFVNPLDADFHIAIDSPAIDWLNR